MSGMKNMDASATQMSGAIEQVAREISGIEMITDPLALRKRSRDFFWYSPILNEQLNGKAADLIAVPENEADVVRVARACARNRVPLTVRAGGTGNYGQAVPLHGGVLLDMSKMTRLLWHRPGVMRAEAGAKLTDLDMELAPSGWEQRMHPSTKRSATVGGFVAGGSGGVGSVTWGGLREPGNIIAARVVTLEEEPRVIELRADAAQKVNRAYGTTGIITEIEMPLAARHDWIDLVVAFDDFYDAMAFGKRIAHADGIAKKLVTPIAWPLPSYFGALRPKCPDGKAVLIAMIAAPHVEEFKAQLSGFSAEVTHEEPSREGKGEVPLYEYTWNHTTLQMLKADRSITYLQCLFPHDRLIELVRQMAEAFPDEIIPHCEFIRFAGYVTASALPVVRFTTAERLNEIIAYHEDNGVLIANPHVVTLEDGSRHKRADADQLGFKHEVDPMGLLNPGKMRTFEARR